MSAWTWLEAHPGFVGAVAWPLMSAVVTSFFKPRTPEEYNKIAKFSPRFAAFLQLVGALGLDVPKVIEAVRKVVSGENRQP